MPQHVLITGASGLIGGLTIKHLGSKYIFHGLSRRPVPGIPHWKADITDPVAMRPAFDGVDTVLHLAAATGADEWLAWPATMAITAQGTVNVYEAARAAGVRRVVQMSSGCVHLAYEWDKQYPFDVLVNGPDDQIPDKWPMVDENWPARPDSPYAVAKLFGENLGRFYADKHNISTIIIRLGAVLPDDKPQLRRQLPGYLSQADCLQMIDLCLSAPDDVRFDVFNAISNNRLRWRSTEHAQQVLGWRPTGRAEDHPTPTK